MEFEPLLNAALQNAFPAVVAIYLLVRFEAKLDVLADVIKDLQCALEIGRRD